MGALRIAAAATGVAALGAAAFGLVARFLPMSNHLVLIGAAFAPFLMACAVLGLVIFGIQRRWLPASIGAAMVIAAVVVEAPLFISDAPPPNTAALRVMTANLYLGQGDPHTVVSIAVRSADVVAFQELTPAERRGLADAGLDRTFPFHVLDLKPEASGTGMFSRFPISDPAVHHGFVNGLISARIQLPGVKTAPTLLVAHMAGPWPQPIDQWALDLERAVPETRQAATSAGDGCVIVAGDFNATYDMAPFRTINREGYRAGADQAGAGLIPTYPANRSVPPFLGIDHVLTYQCTATSTTSFEVPGSDHRGLLSNVEIPRGS